MSKAVEYYYGNSSHCFANSVIQYNPFSQCCLLLCFSLSGLCTIELSLYFDSSAIEHVCLVYKFLYYRVYLHF